MFLFSPVRSHHLYCTVRVSYCVVVDRSVYSIAWSPDGDAVLYTHGRELIIKPLIPVRGSLLECAVCAVQCVGCFPMCLWLISHHRRLPSRQRGWHMKHPYCVLIGVPLPDRLQVLVRIGNIRCAVFVGICCESVLQYAVAAYVAFDVPSESTIAHLC